MKELKDNYSDYTLINRYLNGGGSNVERRQIEERLKKDDVFRALFSEIEAIWEASTLPWQDMTLHKTDIRSDWHKLQARINPQLLVTEELKAKVASRKTSWIPRTYGHMMRLAAILVFTILTSVMLTYFMINNVEDIQEIAFREIMTDRSQRAATRLSDGTMVSLSVDSKIRVPDIFARDVREVELTGEAYFDVAHSPDRPFVIRSGDAVIKVLGTDFGVRAYPDEKEVRVVVKSGSVSVSSTSGNSSNTVVLKPGQLARVVCNTSEINTEWVNPDAYLGWISGKLSFNNSTFSEVISQIERWYDLEVILEDKMILDRRLTAVIDSRSLLNVLNVISQSVDISYEVIDNKVFLRNK